MTHSQQPCHNNPEVKLSCQRIIEDLEENTAIPTSKFNFAKCRFDKSGKGIPGPLGERK